MQVDQRPIILLVYVNVAARGIRIPPISVKWRTNLPAVASSKAIPSSTVLSPWVLHRRCIHLTKPQTQIFQFKLSDIGEGITEVTIKEWFVKEGDRVSQFDNICEVQSDKASVTITSRYDGVVKKLHYSVDETARVGQPLVDIDGEGDAEESDSDSSAQDMATSQPITAETQVGFDRLKVLATPAVRRIASEYRVDLINVTGTGKAGRVMKEDIIAYLNGISVETHSAPSKLSPLSSVVARSQPTVVKQPHSIATAVMGADRTEPVTGYTKAMVKTMTAANAVPHFVYSDEVDVGHLISFRSQLLGAAKKRNVKLTYMPFVLKAVSRALLEFPVLNATVNEDCSQITYKTRHNIGFAMDTPSGLVVPNVKDVQSLKVLDIAREMSRLIEAGMRSSLAPLDVTGGSFSVSNIGAIGGTYMKPVLLVPEVAIGAIGRFQKLPRFNESGGIEAANIMVVSWAADHRIVDGATVARFSNMFKELLENPVELLLE